MPKHLTLKKREMCCRCCFQRVLLLAAKPTYVFLSQERFRENRDVAQTALADAYEKSKFYTLEKLCDYIDTQHQYFKTALEAVDATKQKVEDYRRYIAKVRGGVF